MEFKGHLTLALSLAIAILACPLAARAETNPEDTDSCVKIRVVNVCVNNPEITLRTRTSTGGGESLPIKYGSVSDYFHLAVQPFQPGQRSECQVIGSYGQIVGPQGQFNFIGNGRDVYGKHFTMFYFTELTYNQTVLNHWPVDFAVQGEDQFDAAAAKYGNARTTAQLRIIQYFGNSTVMAGRPKSYINQGRPTSLISIDGVQQKRKVTGWLDVFPLVPGAHRITLKGEKDGVTFFDKGIPLYSGVNTTILILDTARSEMVAYRFDEDKDHPLRWTATL